MPIIIIKKRARRRAKTTSILKARCLCSAYHYEEKTKKSAVISIILESELQIYACMHACKL